MPKISVIMPVYNCEKYIKQAVGSILNQTYKDFELIIVDDGSTDDTIANIPADKRIVLVNMPHAGTVYQLNVGLSMAEGEYIARHDGDDYSDPRRFEIQADYLDKNDIYGYDVVGSGMLLIDHEDFPVEIMTYPTTPTMEELMKRCCVAHPTVMFRRSVYENIGGYDEEFNQNCCEDYDFWLRVREKHKILNISRVLYTKRVHRQSSVELNRVKVPVFDELARVKARIRRLCGS